MSEHQGRRRPTRAMPEAVATKQQRRLKARRGPERTIWFGLGMFGLVGWSVAVPALIGVGVGLWIDHHWPSRYSWTLMLLLAGVCFGCLHAWRWVHRESELDEQRGAATDSHMIAENGSLEDKP